MASKTKTEELYEKYPWLKVTTTLADYVKPSYYDKLIKDYGYKGKSDLDYTNDFLLEQKNQDLNVLEFGSGTGRATKLITKYLNFKKLTLVDLSPQMIDTLKDMFGKDPRIYYAKYDHLEFMNQTKEVFDIVVSLWSLSHSIHQHFDKDKSSDRKIVGILENFFTQNLSSNGKAFIIHFDTLSDEQRILTKQWAKVYPNFAKYYFERIQSPSKQILDKLLKDLSMKGVLKYDCKHITGDKIIYESMNEALEVFMNFHLESHFNTLNIVSDIIEDLISELNKFKDKNGKIRIAPGFFIYTISK